MKIKIKTWDEMEKEYGIAEWGNLNTPCSFPPAMEYLCGQEIELTKFWLNHGNWGLIDDWAISREMIHCLENCNECVWKFHKNLERKCNYWFKPIKHL
jgi:hypothetical protein